MSKTACYDLSADLGNLLGENVDARRLTYQPVCPKVAPGDGMYTGDGRHYLGCGLSALRLIALSLESSGIDREAVAKVLDYGCGYGRVIRWLAAAFPNARVQGADVDTNALSAVSTLMGLEVFPVSKDLSRSLGTGYDLIWVGSVLTHVSEEYGLRLIRFLGGLLGPKGMIVATTHGRYVANRLLSRKVLYNLEEDSINRLLQEFGESGYAFVPYSHATDYGISIVDAHVMARILNDEGYETILFANRGWAKHQDVFAFRPFGRRG